MAQFTNLSIRLSLRQCESINLQLSVARATTLINHTETERDSYMAAALHLSLSHFPRLFGSLVWFECGPWVDISIALAQLLWLSILKLLLVFLSRLLIPQISLAISFALSLALCVGHLEIVTSYGCDRRLSIRIVCRQSSIHLISFFRNNKKRSRYFQIVFSWRR